METNDEIMELLNTLDVPTTVQQPQSQSQHVLLTNEDFDEILQRAGFQEVHDAEAEEMFDEIYEEDEVLQEEEEEEEEQEEEINTTQEESTTITDSQPTPVDNQNDNQMIPLNSPTLLIDDSTSRFSGAEWFEEIKKQRIILAGLGGIGSWTALQLARMTPESIYLYDDDVVEEANLSGQFFSTGNAGFTKSQAVYRNITSFSKMRNVNAINGRFTDTTEPGPIMICGFDNMAARKTFFNRWMDYITGIPEEQRKTCLFIDGRLSMDVLQVLCIRGDDTYNIENYKTKYLFSDEEADHTVCSMKQTTYLACMISSFITNLFTNHVANLLEPVIPYSMPFFTEYDAKYMIFKIEN